MDGGIERDMGGNYRRDRIEWETLREMERYVEREGEKGRDEQLAYYWTSHSECGLCTTHTSRLASCWKAVAEAAEASWMQTRWRVLKTSIWLKEPTPFKGRCSDLFFVKITYTSCTLEIPIWYNPVVFVLLYPLLFLFVWVFFSL